MYEEVMVHYFVSDSHLIGTSLKCVAFVSVCSALNMWLPFQGLPLYPHIPGVRSLLYWIVPHDVGAAGGVSCVSRAWWVQVSAGGCWGRSPLLGLLKAAAHVSAQTKSTFLRQITSMSFVFCETHSGLCITPLSNDSNVHTISHSL